MCFGCYSTSPLFPAWLTVPGVQAPAAAPLAREEPSPREDQQQMMMERRPSWRLRLDEGDKNKVPWSPCVTWFMLLGARGLQRWTLLF